MPLSISPRNDFGNTMELAKIILDFAARIAYPFLIGLLLIIYRRPLETLFRVLAERADRILQRVESGKPIYRLDRCS